MKETVEITDEMFIAEIINTYTRVLYNFIRRFSFTDQETEDILQDVFIKTWKNKDNFDEEKSSLKTWIFTITRNTIYDALRKKKGSKIVTSLDNEDHNGNTYESEDVTSDIIHILEREQSKKILLEAIDKLSEAEKTILLLHTEESMTFNEISDIFDTSINTVKSNYRRSLMKLKLSLENMHQNKK